MKKYFALLIPVCISVHLSAQDAGALAAAEKAFEKSCLDSGIRNGFLANVDSNGIAFTQKGPVDAKQFWRSLPAFEGIFSWSPSYSEISVSGNFGYTTGNYEHRPKSLNDTPDQCGQYTTLWGKNDQGEWKYLIDIGTSHDCMALDKNPEIITIKKSGAGQEGSQEKLSKMEEEFTGSVGINTNAAYLKYGSAKYILNLPQHHPVTSRDSAVILVNKMGALTYHPAGIKISPGKDMAAAYGTFESGSKTGSYMRIWRYEKSGWKIAVEVIRG